ncbi:hypothetical protein GGI02_005879 [Coemansia sp. RSA 2322]|nr:hypothetical protein GGI02_005879 [Coemansia sp. RSA 2322]
MSQKEILGRGIEQLLKFHSALAPITEAGEIDYWRAKVSDSFSDIGIIRLELGSQTYNMPVAAAGSFYHLLFGEDCGVVSMHVALGQPRVYPLRQTASIMSFHGVQMTTTYSNGRRVLETGDLRVIFDESFRIRLWAFSSDDATVCLPRKRPNASDDSLTRTSEATIARNLDWPNLSPAPKRRKSANGKQPPEECALPAVALQRLEIVNTMYNLQDLVVLQLQDKNTSMGIMELWMKTVNPKPLPPSKQPTKQLSGPERKRPRKKSTAAMQPPPPATASAGPTNTAELVSANDAKSRFATITPSPSVAAKPAHQPLKH